MKHHEVENEKKKHEVGRWLFKIVIIKVLNLYVFPK